MHQRRMEQQGILEQRDVRFRVVEDFLNLRGRNEADPNRWSMILEDGFQLRLPRADIPGVVCSSGGPATPAQSNEPCHSYPLGTSKKVLTGVNEVMEDSRMVASLLQSLGASALSVSYQCDRESFMMDSASAVLSWMATSSGAVTKVSFLFVPDCIQLHSSMCHFLTCKLFAVLQHFREPTLNSPSRDHSGFASTPFPTSWFTWNLVSNRAAKQQCKLRVPCK